MLYYYLKNNTILPVTIYLIYRCTYICLGNTILRLNIMFQTYINVVKLYKISIDVHKIILGERNKLGLIADDSRGQLFSLDLLFALIPLILVLGIVASDMDNIMYLVQDTVFQGSTNRVAADTMNTLLETSGQPTCWEQTGNPTIAGLAPSDSNGNPVEGMVSTAKLSALTATDVQNIVGNDYSFYLLVSEIDNTTNPVSYIPLRSLSTNGSGYNDNASNIVRIEKTALYSNVVYSIVGQIKGAGVSRTYNSPTLDCFQTNEISNDTYDYWVLVNNSGFVSSNIMVYINSGNVSLQYYDANTLRAKIDPELLNLNTTNPVSNTVTVDAVGAPGSYLDFYIVEVPKNADNVNLNTKEQKSCRFELYLWANKKQ